MLKRKVNTHLEDRCVEVNDRMSNRLGRMEIQLGSNEEKLTLLDTEIEKERGLGNN